MMDNSFCCKGCGGKEFRIEYNIFDDHNVPNNHIVVTCNKCEKLFIINGDYNSIEDCGTGILDIKKEWDKNG